MTELPAGAVAPDVAFEPAALAARFAHLLRSAGLEVGPDRAGRFARGLRLLPPARRESLYWAARITLVPGQGHLAVFDRVFAAVFDGRLDPADSRGDTTTEPPPTGGPPARRTAAGAPGEAAPPSGSGAATLPAQADGTEDGDREGIIAAASMQERLRHTAFAALTPAELAELRHLVRRIRLVTPPRRTRRTRPSPRAGEQIDLRRTLRRAQHTGGDPARLLHRRRSVRPRRLVLLCDVSGSMEPYTQVFLSLLHGAVTEVSAEAFVFATRLTRLTASLDGRSLDPALARAAATAQDWSGGTRLGASLRRFVDDYGHRRVARGAVVVILSDGWSCDDPAEVAQQMARLGRLAYRVVWVNPRKAAPGFAPLVGGMAAALPYCDAFVSGHSLAALTEVAAAIGDVGGSA